MNIRIAFAMEVAEQVGAHMLCQLCPTCESPLMEKPEQDVPFCWSCVTDKMAAHRAKTLLTKLKMRENIREKAAQGIVYETRTAVTDFIL